MQRFIAIFKLKTIVLIYFNVFSQNTPLFVHMLDSFSQKDKIVIKNYERQNKSTK